MFAFGHELLAMQILTGDYLMLFGLVHQVSDTISELDPMQDAPAFVNTWLEHRPEQREAAFPEETDPESRDIMFQMFAAGALTIVKRMPEMMDVMTERMYSSEVDPAVQCAVATVLAYVVQPRDLIPDGAPGGYGFIDDAILLHAGYLDILSMEPPHAERFKTQEEYLSFIVNFAPSNVMAELRRTVQSMESTMSVFRMLPPDALEVATAIIVDDPFSASSRWQSQGEKDGFRSARFLAETGSDAVQHVTHDGDTIIVHIPGGRITSDGRVMYQM
jgi:uncharacterized membrane protein YkvA (DUF1232 family)